ncbi:prepilin-type N-terminal cleavage/methylation domain-containing protein [Candidatus Parcubacteria bacterium]|nr:MAG: prepilin-type N-terminal cleavage/methylation domain-containing protein [Candidatus Parcubacteria bacterium]
MRKAEPKVKFGFRHNAKAFTLIELIIVVAIIAVVAIGIFVVVNPAKRIGESQDAQRWADLTAIAKAIELYTADNGALPSDFNLTSLAEGEKFVLCSSSGSLSCDGQTESCLVIDDTNFLGVYLNTLPIDPEKTVTTDTGYYVTRGSSDAITLGACDPYTSGTVEIASQISLPTLVTVCGDGDAEGSEVCDDGDTFTEGCGNNVVESAGSYCNSNCTATITILVNERCDYSFDEACYTGMGYYHTSAPSSEWTYCKSTCDTGADACFPPP